MKLSKFAPVLFLLAVAACGGDDPDDNPNGNRVVERYPGGGTGGGAIEGKFSLFVEKSNGSGVIQDATVVVVAGGKSLTAKTNLEGRVDFEDAALNGPVTVHIFHADYAYQSLVNLNASVATFSLSKLVPDPQPMVETAVIKGNVEGWELIAESPKVAFVNPVGSDIVIFPPTERDPPNDAFLKNVAPDFPGQLVAHDYELTIDTRVTGLVIEAGPLPMGAYEAQYVGFVGGISATSGAVIMKDVAFTHRLDQNLTVSISGPMGLGSPSVGLLVALPGDDGEVVIGSENGASLMFRVPKLDGSLSGAKFVGFGEMSATNGTDRTRAVSAHEASGTTAALTLQALPGKPTIMDRTVAATAVSGATLHEFDLANTMGVIQWSVLVIGEPTATLPDVPVGFSDRLTGTMDLSVLAINFGAGVDLNNAKFSGLGRTTFDSSESITRVSF